MAPMLNTFTLLALHYAGKVSTAAIELRSTSAYAPVSAACPSPDLVRPASGICSAESTYIMARKARADIALAEWLTNTDSGFDTTSLPTLGLALTGGGLRATLCGAGVIKGFDSRDTNVGTSGILQSLTYMSSLSGGGWLTGALAGNDWPTISSLTTSMWHQNFEDTLLDPDYLLASVAYTEIVADIIRKAKTGLGVSLADVYGRLLGYQFLQGSDGGVAKTMSGLITSSNYTSYNVPFPILTARGLLSGECSVDINATQWEFTPSEFGSWDSGVAAFTQTAYLGSDLTNGSATVAGKCISNFDNLGFLMGTSSDIFNDLLCSAVSATNSTGVLIETLEAIVARVDDTLNKDLFALYPNPFYHYAASFAVAEQSQLRIVDGGEGGQAIPIWPLIQDSRSVDVVIILDVSTDTDDDYPDGTNVLTTYQQAQASGLSRMPYIPPVDTWLAEGLNTRATFFGCNDSSVVTLVYLPNKDYTYASNTSTYQIQYSASATDDMIANGVQIATQGGDTQWPTCLACAIMKKTDTTLPEACTACFEKYCYGA